MYQYATIHITRTAADKTSKNYDQLAYKPKRERSSPFAFYTGEPGGLDETLEASIPHRTLD